MTEEHELPPGWAWVDVEQVILDCQYGSSAKTSEDPSGVPVLRMGNIQDGLLELGRLKHLPATHSEFPTLLLKTGDLLFNRTNSVELVGKSAVYAGHPSPCSYASYLVRLRMSEACLPKYLCFYLNSQSGRRWVRSVVSQQVGQANVNSTKLRACRFPLAPAAEQYRIVERIEELLSDLDAGVKLLERARAKLKKYRAAVLKAAVTGELTADWRAAHPDVEPASEAIKRVPTPPRPSRFATRSKDIIPGHAALSVGPTEAPLPVGWARTPLVEIARMESGHTPSREHPEWWQGDIPWVGIADAREHHAGFIHNTHQHTNQGGLDNSAARLLPAGTVCVSRTASVGYVVELGRPMATSQDFVNWVPSEVVTSGWLRVVFMADREALRRFGKGSVHKTIYFPEWMSVYLAVPPVPEQKVILTEVEQQLTVIAACEGYIAAGLKRAGRLRQSILKEAFAGRLVPQDPTDEPASVLLDHIRQSRHADNGSADVKRPRGRRKKADQAEETAS